MRVVRCLFVAVLPWLFLAPIPARGGDSLPSFPDARAGKGDSTVQQEDTARHRRPPPRVPPLLTAEPAASIALPPVSQMTLQVIDSLVRTHPELKEFLLREYLVPTRPMPDFTPPNDHDRFLAYVREHFPGSTFDRMSAIARGHAAVTNVPFHSTIGDYQLDIIGTIDWLLGLSH